MTMPFKQTFLILTTLFFLASCNKAHFPWVYRIDIPQGNFVTDTMVAELETGMTPEQVQNIMGPPMLIDTFTPNTWYYLMVYRPGKGDVVKQEITVYFKDGLYDRYDGEIIEDFQEKTQGSKDRDLENKARQQSKEVIEAD